MQHKITRFVSVLLFAVTVFNGIALTSQRAYAAVTPQQINDATTKFTDALGKFSANSAADKIGKIANFCSRLGGLTSLASGIIGVLQMAGIIKDPTQQMIHEVLNVVKDVQTQLDNINNTLNQIAHELVNIQVAQQEINRNNKATTMSTNWNNFNTNYTERFETYVSEYQAKIISGIQQWWNQNIHSGFYVLMTKSYTEEAALTYSTKDYSDTFPSVSDIVNDAINAAWSIGIPAAVMPVTHTVPFNVNTYREDFKKIVVTALGKAIEDNTLASNCGASVKSAYRNTSSRQAMLEAYADNLLNTIIYRIACQVMTENNSWVSGVISLYSQYCENILQQNSGINAFLNYIYQTHGFEGEAHDQIINFLDAMIAQVGFYGEFVLTCAGQDSLQTTAIKEQIRDNFVNTVTAINNKKSSGITGHSNYCYITGTILEAGTTSIGAVTYMHADGREYTGCDNRGWSISIPGIIDSVYMPIIYKQYKQLPEGANSFGEYLNNYSVQSDTDNKTYLTQYRGTEDFAFSEGIYMVAENCIGGSDYFSSGSWYHIDVGTGSKVDQSCYPIHNKVVGDWFDSSNGNQDINTTIAARAAYGESHWTWHTDESWVFASEGFGMSVGDGYHDDKYVSYNRTVNIIKSTPYHDVKGSADDPLNPFFAFDRVSLTPGVSDFTGMHYENKSKDITDIELESDSFVYNGVPVEPAVTVYDSGDIVPEDCYEVTYWNNTAAGDYAYVKVQGKGDYNGHIVRRFMITSSDSGSSGARAIENSSSGGCNAMGGLFAAFGLAFVIRKFRRR